MARLIYATPTSLDGYIADETGNPDWAAPDEEGFAFISDLLRPIGLYLYGRKMYETMAIWETPDVIPDRDSGDAGLRADLASGRQDRLFQIAGDRLDTEDASRAGIRPARRSRAEDSIASRPFGRWSHPRGRCDPDRACRRVSSVRRACHPWRRPKNSAHKRIRKAGSCGGSPVCEWMDLSSVSDA